MSYGTFLCSAITIWMREAKAIIYPAGYWYNFDTYLLIHLKNGTRVVFFTKRKMIFFAPSTEINLNDAICMTLDRSFLI
jgi:hypothetical protein